VRWYFCSLEDLRARSEGQARFADNDQRKGRKRRFWPYCCAVLVLRMCVTNCCLRTVLLFPDCHLHPLFFFLAPFSEKPASGFFPGTGLSWNELEVVVLGMRIGQKFSFVGDSKPVASSHYIPLLAEGKPSPPLFLKKALLSSLGRGGMRCRFFLEIPPFLCMCVLRL